MRALKKTLFALACAALAGQASAGESGFGWIYNLDLHPKGTWEFEQKAELQRGQSQGDYDMWKFHSELEYGVTDNYQASLYINTSHVNAYRNGINGETSGPGVDIVDPAGLTQRYKKTKFDSISMENIWRLTNPVTDNIGVGLYLEPELGLHEEELEGRLILQKNFIDDRLQVVGNLTASVEREHDLAEVERASSFETMVGFTYRFADRMTAGLEYRNHREFEGYRFNTPEHSAHFIGPNFHYAAKNWWATLAWRHQLRMASAYQPDQTAAMVDHRIYGDEHTRNEFMLKLGIPF